MTVTGPGKTTTVTTDADGYYSVTGLTPGDYRVAIDKKYGPTPIATQDCTPSGAICIVHLDQDRVADFTVTAGVLGQVRDIILNWPPSAHVDVNSGVPGATVQLLAADGSVVDETTSDATGLFSLRARKKGRYTVEVIALANRYDPRSDKVQSGQQRVLARQKVTINRLSGPPVEVNPYAPVSLVDRVEGQMYDLHHLDKQYTFLVTFGLHQFLTNIADFYSLQPLRREVQRAFSYDTTAVQAVVDKACSLGFLYNSFKGVYLGWGEKDGWNAVIRLSMYLYTFEQTYTGAADAIDVGARTLSVAVMTTLASYGSQLIDGDMALAFGGQYKGGLAKLSVQGVKAAQIALLGDGSPTLLPTILDRLGVSGPHKAEIIDRYYKALRFSFDAALSFMARKDLQNDFVFEVLFGIMRIAGTVEGLALYVSQTQGILDGAATNDAGENLYAGNTYDGMNLATALAGVIQKRVDFWSGTVNANVGYFTSLLRGTSGALGSFSANDFSTVPKWPDWLKQRVSNLIDQRESGKLIKVGNGTWYALSLYAIMLGISAVEELNRACDTTNYQYPVFGGKASPSKACYDIPGFAPNHSAVNRSRPSWLPTGPRLSGEFAAWQNEMKTVLADVKAGHISTATAHVQGLIAAEGRLSSDVNLVYGRAQAQLVNPLALKGAPGELERFIEGRRVAANSVAEADQFLALALAAPNQKTRNGALQVSNLALAAVDDLRADTSGVLPLVGEAKGIPASLFVSSVNIPALATILSGKAFQVQIQLTNAGDKQTSAAAFTASANAPLRVVKGGAQGVRPLQPGRSAVVTIALRAPGAMLNRLYLEPLTATVTPRNGTAISQNLLIGGIQTRPPGAGDKARVGTRDGLSHRGHGLQIPWLSWGRRDGHTVSAPINVYHDLQN